MERDPHQLIEGVLIACYAIGCRPGVPLRPGRDGPRPGAHRRGAQRGLRRGLRRPATSSAPTSRVDIVLHWGAGAYIVGEETGPHRVARGQPGHAPPQAAVLPGGARACTCSPRSSTTSRRWPNLPWIISNGGAGFAELGAEATPRHPPVRGVGHVDEPGRVRGRVRRHHLPRPVLRARLRRRHPRRQRAQGVHPRRRLGPVVLRRAPRPPAREGRRRPGRLDARLRRHRRHGRHHRRGEGRAAGGALLRPRVVRQVHAVPRGHAAGWRRSSSASSTATAARATSTCCSTSATTSPGRPDRLARPTQTTDLPRRLGPLGRSLADRLGDRAGSATSSRSQIVRRDRIAVSSEPVDGRRPYIATPAEHPAMSETPCPITITDP